MANFRINKQIERLKKANQKAKTILSKYKSVANLKKYASRYQLYQRKNKNNPKSTDNPFKKGSFDYKTYRKLLTTIKKLKDNINQHNVLINKEGFCDSFEGEDTIHRIKGKASHDQLEGEVSRNQIEGKDNSDRFEKDSCNQTGREDTNENIEGEDTNENIEGEDTNENIEEEETYEYIEGEGAHENIEGEDTQNQVVIDEICSNCKRRQHNHLIEHYGRNSVYCMSFHQCSNNTIRRKKFKHSDIRINNEEIIYTLCNECNEYLTTESNNNTESSCWPAFLIKFSKIQTSTQNIKTLFGNSYQHK